jgi:hypothetical protein
MCQHEIAMGNARDGIGRKTIWPDAAYKCLMLAMSSGSVSSMTLTRTSRIVTWLVPTGRYNIVGQLHLILAWCHRKLFRLHWLSVILGWDGIGWRYRMVIGHLARLRLVGWFPEVKFLGSVVDLLNVGVVFGA